MRALLLFSNLISAVALAAGAGDAPRGCPETPDVLPLTSLTLRGAHRHGWVVHQAVLPERADPFFKAAERSAVGWKAISPEQAAPFLGGRARLPLWVFPSSGAAACRARTGQLWAVREGHEDEWRTFIVADVQAGCALADPGDVSGFLVALREEEEPSGCRVRQVVRQGGGQGESAPPADTRSFVPARRCVALGCDRAWELWSARLDGGAAVGELRVRWEERRGENQCLWKRQGQAIRFLQPAHGVPVRLQAAGELYGLLEDAWGPRAVLSTSEGSLVLHRSGAPTPFRAVRFSALEDEEEEGESERLFLGPPCRS